MAGGKPTGKDDEEARTQTSRGTFSGTARRSRIIVKNRKESPRYKRKPNAALAEPGDSRPRPSPASEAASLERQVPEKPDAGKNYKTAVRSYHFHRARTPGIIEVLNENSYVMAEYSERTGAVKWQRMVLASQREQIEKWLEDHFPKV